MIKELTLKNFKSWKAIENMKFSQITGLFGANSSGKTSILQLLLLIKQTVESTDRLQVLDFGNEKSPANLGNFVNVVYSHDRNNKLECELKWKLAKSLTIKNAEESKKGETKDLFCDDEITFSVEISESDKQKLVVNKLIYRFAGYDFILRQKGQGREKYELLATNGFKFIRSKGRVWDLPVPIKCYGFPNEINARFKNAGFLSDLQLEFERLFTSAKYLGPLREYPKRQYPWSGAEPIDMGMRGERVVEAILAARQNDHKVYFPGGGLQKKIPLDKRVAIWLKELGLVSSFSVDAVTKEGRDIYRVNIKRSANSADVQITDVGFGVSQILPAIVLCYYAPQGSTIILEQPEIHLHPSVQAGLADIFIDAAKTRNIQIIFESHSEHLLKRLQRRIAEEKISSDKVSLYFCEYETSNSRINELDIDLYGDIRNWPKDFFGNQFGEMVSIMKASINRKK